MKINKITLEMHTCDKKKFPHEPELKMEFNTIKEAIFKGKELVEKLKAHAYINWDAKKGYRYLINYPDLSISKHRIKKR